MLFLTALGALGGLSLVLAALLALAYRRLRVEWGLRRSAPIVEGVVVAPGLDAQPLRVLGVDPLAEGPFRDHIASGTLGAPGFSRFFTDPLAVLVGAPMAERHGLTIGSRLPVRIDDREVALEVLGLIRPGDPGDASVLDGLLIMDVGSAQELLAREGRLSHIDCAIY